MKIFAIVVEPANYTLELIKNIYVARNVEYAFMRGASIAANKRAKDCDVVLSQMSICKLVKYLWGKLKQCDVFVINGYTGKIPLIFIVLNQIFFKKPFGIESDTELIIPEHFFKRVLKWAYLHCLFGCENCFGLAGGNFGHKDLFRHYGMPENRIFLLPMMVNNSLYQRKSLRQSHGGDFYFGYLGRLIPLKRVDKILDAFNMLLKEIPNIKMVVVGDGCCRGDLELRYKSARVTFLGKLFGEEKVAFLQNLDCLILYSSYESWGLVVNEALAAGVPVIVSDRVGARRDLVAGDCPTGFVARWDDTCDLAERMKILATDIDQYNIFEKNAQARMHWWNYELYGKCLDEFIACATTKVRGYK